MINCTYFTEPFSKLMSAGLKHHLPKYFFKLPLTVWRVSDKHRLLTQFLSITVWFPHANRRYQSDVSLCWAYMWFSECMAINYNVRLFHIILSYNSDLFFVMKHMLLCKQLTLYILCYFDYGLKCN